jgi:hypothetical protein
LINNSVTIVVNTCDSYSDVWELFYLSFQLHWPDRKVEMVFNTEYKTEFGFPVSFCRMHNSTSKFWGERLLETLESLDSDFVFMLFDDFILEEDFDVNGFEKCLNNLAHDTDISAIYLDDLRVISNTGIFLDSSNFQFELLDKASDFRLNSAPGLWRRKHLIKYTEKEDTPWAWEVFGTYRTQKEDNKFYHCKSSQKIFSFDGRKGGAIYRGKWVRDVVEEKVKRFNLNLDLTIRGFTSELSNEKRTFLWKIQFLLLGYKMVGFDVFKFIFRSIRKKIL